MSPDNDEYEQMNFLIDFLPIVVFFIVYKFYGIYAVTCAAIVLSFIQVISFRLKHKHFESMQLITLALIAVLGGATLYLHDETFIKWKPTAINWLFALAFFLSQFIGKQPLIERMMAKNIHLPKPIWTKLNLSWVVFFIVMGIANLYVVYHFDTNTWVNFKLFGMLGLTLLFVIIQAFYLMRHSKDLSL